MGLRYQLSQLWAPFPEPGSWAYNINTALYDLRHGRAVEDKEIAMAIRHVTAPDEVLERMAEDGTDEEPLDVPAYVRRYSGDYNGDGGNGSDGSSTGNHGSGPSSRDGAAGPVG